MKNTLQAIIPKIIDLELPPIFVAFEGKQDLEKNIPLKLRGWKTPLCEARFIVVRDNDRHPRCLEIKARLRAICADNKHPNALIRLVCQELESWFLGDLKAVGKAFGNDKLADAQAKAKFKNPDQLGNPEKELLKLVREYQKFGGSRKIAPHMDLNNNHSHSFNVFIQGIRRIPSQVT